MTGGVWASACKWARGGKGGGDGGRGGEGKGKGGQGRGSSIHHAVLAEVLAEWHWLLLEGGGQLGRRRRRVPYKPPRSGNHTSRAAGAECGCLLRGARMWPPDSGSLLRLNSSNLPPDAKELRSRIE